MGEVALPVTDELHADRFWVRQTDPKTGRPAWFMTPLFLALIMIEIADLDIRGRLGTAIFAITTDPFIVYTSNIFAILGLRALYFFALAALVHRFHYLKYALSVLLVFIGSKIFLADWLGLPMANSRLPGRSNYVRHSVRRHRLVAGGRGQRALEIRSGKGVP